MKFILYTLLLFFTTVSIFGQNNDCNCFEFGNAKIEDSRIPALQLNLKNGKTAAICGYVDTAFSSAKFLMSNFYILDCSANKIIADYNSVETCTIEKLDNEIIISQMITIPIGTNWNWEFVPFIERTCKLDSNLFKLSKEKLVLNLPHYSDKSFIDIVKDIEKNSDFYSRTQNEKKLELIIGKLLIGSLKKNKEATKLFLELKDLQGISLSKEMTDWYDEALGIYSKYQNLK